MSHPSPWHVTSQLLHRPQGVTLLPAVHRPVTNDPHSGGSPGGRLSVIAGQQAATANTRHVRGAPKHHRSHPHHVASSETGRSLLHDEPRTDRLLEISTRHLCCMQCCEQGPQRYIQTQQLDQRRVAAEVRQPRPQSVRDRQCSGTYRHSSSISTESLQKSDSHGRSQSEIGSAAVHIDTAARSAPSRCRRQTATAAVSPRSAVQHVLSATPSNRVRPRHTEPDRPAERAPNNSANGQWPELAQH